MMNSRERRLSLWSNAICAMPLCEALSSRRGRGPDSAIVAVKPTNKAERSAAEQSAAGTTAAESVERRAETKGNVDQPAHAPDSAPHKRVTDAGSHTAAHSCRGYQGGNHMRESCTYGTPLWTGFTRWGAAHSSPFSDRNGRHRSRLIVSASRNGAAASHSAFRIAFGNSMARLMPRSVRTSTISY
jgi:hypothetical protein